MTFKELNISEPIIKALENKKYENPTPIQEKAIPPALDGSDLLGIAQTGTGKTAAFAIPIVQQLDELHFYERRREIKALVLTPTRELAIQIGRVLEIMANTPAFDMQLSMVVLTKDHRLISCDEE